MTQYEVTQVVQLGLGTAIDMAPGSMLVEGPGRSHYVLEPVESEEPEPEPLSGSKRKEPKEKNTATKADNAAQTREELQGLPYRELQKIAGEYPDIKGNLPKDEMLDAIAEASNE